MLGRSGVGARLGERACGRRWACVGARAGAAGSWAHGRSGARSRRSPGQAGRAVTGARGAQQARGHGMDARGARDRSRQGRAGRPAGRPVRTWVCSAGPGWGFVHPDSVFGPV